MASKRSLRIIEMSKKDLDLLSDLSAPKYESTKGSSRREQKILLLRQHDLFNNDHPQISARVSPYPQETDSEYSKNVFKEIDQNQANDLSSIYFPEEFTADQDDSTPSKKNEIHIISDIVIKPLPKTKDQHWPYTQEIHCSGTYCSPINSCLEALQVLRNDDGITEGAVHKTDGDNLRYDAETPEEPFQPSDSEYFPSEEEDGNSELENCKISNGKKKKRNNKKKTKIDNNRENESLIEQIQDLALSPRSHFPSEEDGNSYSESCKISNEKKKKGKPKIKNNQEKESLEQIQDLNSSPITNFTKNKNSQQKQEDDNFIEIHRSKNDSTGRRIRDKLHVCYYCNKHRKQMAIHFEICHNQENEVIQLLAMEKKSKVRRDGFSSLIRTGDYYHNCEVLSKNQGELILVRSPSEGNESSFNYQVYGPCPDCLGFMLKKFLWHHMKHGCIIYSGKQIKTVKRNPISESNALLIHTYEKGLSHEFSLKILNYLKLDKISLICKQDLLILEYGSMQFEKYGSTQCELIRQSMRQLARLVAELRATDSKKTYLSDWLVPEHFDNIIFAVRNIAKFTEKGSLRPNFGTPSLALKLGYSLKKCIAIFKGMFLKKNDRASYEKLNSLSHLMDLEWNIKISANALATLHDQKLNSVELLPITNDLILLNNFLNDKLAEAKNSLSKECNDYYWTTLANVILAKIILFNKRRSGEASKMTMHQYSSRPDWSQTGTEEFKNSMTPLELELSKTLTLLQIRGERGRHVHILLTPDVKEGIDILNEHRKATSISDKNVYVFARCGNSEQYIRGHDSIRKFSYEADLLRPELINGTKLRKYIATVCQVFNLTENETDWLARHLGHDIRVHREFYRLHDSSVELTKVSRLLLAVESGEASLFKGKSLDDINICDLPDLQHDTEEPNVDGDIDNEQMIYPQSDTPSSNNPGPSNNLGPSDGNQSKNQKGKKKATKSRRPWSQSEKSAVLMFFRTDLKNKRNPGKERCQECLDSTSELTRRDWKDVKYFVFNYMKKNKM